MFVFPRALVLTTLGSCLSWHTARGDLAVSYPQSSDVIVTNCSANPLLPPISPSQGNQTVTVDFGQAAPGNVSCVLTIPAYSNQSSNAVTLILTDTLPLSWCGHHNHLRLYDLDPESGNRTVIAEACDGVTTMSGRPGFDTLIVLEASDVERSNMTLLSYSSFRWSTAVCNSPTHAAVLNATVSKTVLHVPDATHAVPKVPSPDCVWEVRVADGIGVIHVRVTMQDAASAGRSIPGTYGNSSLFSFLDAGVFTTSELLKKIPVTEKGVDFEKTGGDFVTMGLDWHGLGGAPPFTVTYWAESSTQLCPPSPRSFNATLEMQTLTGVNRGLHESAQDRNCYWRISAPSGMVVKLMDIKYIGFHTYSKDKLVIEGKDVPIWDRRLFPIWSEGESVEIDYVSSSMTERSQFVIKYLAVWPGPCQTLVTLNATAERNNVTEVALKQNDTSNGTNCHWLFKGRPGHPVEATVTLENQEGLCGQPWSGVHTGGITAFRGADQTINNLIEPQCLSDSNTSLWRFVSDDVITVVYDRDPKTSYVTDGVIVTYIELPKPTGSACGFSPSVALLSFLLTLSLGRSLLSSFGLLIFA